VIVFCGVLMLGWHSSVSWSIGSQGHGFRFLTTLSARARRADRWGGAGNRDCHERMAFSRRATPRALIVESMIGSIVVDRRGCRGHGLLRVERGGFRKTYER